MKTIFKNLIIFKVSLLVFYLKDLNKFQIPNQLNPTI